MLIYIFKFLDSYLWYLVLWMIISLIVVTIEEYRNEPIEDLGRYRVLDIIPIRDLLIVFPISFYIWNEISDLNKRNVPFIIKFVENIIVMFITGFIIHYLFSIKSMLGNIIGISKIPDGTGYFPYPNY